MFSIGFPAAFLLHLPPWWASFLPGIPDDSVPVADVLLPLRSSHPRLIATGNKWLWPVSVRHSAIGEDQGGGRRNRVKVLSLRNGHVFSRIDAGC